MSSGFFNILGKYGLDKIADLSWKASRLSITDWSNLADELEAYYDTLSPSTDIISPLTFDFPSLPPDLLPKISTHLIFADKVFVDDPLLIIARPLGWKKIQSKGVLEFIAQKHPDLAEEDLEDLYGNLGTIAAFAEETLVDQAVKVLRFYLQAKELIQEGKLVPYNNAISGNWPVKYWETFYNIARKDKRFQSIIGLDKKTAFKVALIPLLLRVIPNKSVLGKNLDTIYEEQLTSLINKMVLAAPMVASVSAFVFTWGNRGRSTDFIHPDLAYLFRMELECIAQLNKELPPHQRILLPSSFSLNGIQIPSLQNVPIERVLEIVSKEPEVFESFRSALNERLLQINAPPGSIEREKEIAAIAENLQKDIYSIQLAFENIRKDFARRFALNLILSTFSIVIAGISAVGQNLNALSLLGSIFASTTLGASAKELVNEWIEFRAKRDELKSSTNYMVWQLLQKK